MDTTRIALLSIGIIILIASQWRRRKSHSSKPDIAANDAITAGKLLFSKQETAWIVLCESLLVNKRPDEQHQILHKNWQLIDGDGNVRWREVMIAFGDHYDTHLLLDWRGEENADELIDFAEEELGRKIVWTNTNRFKLECKDTTALDGKQAVAHLIAVDADLQKAEYRLIDFNSNGDNYLLSLIKAEDWPILKRHLGETVRVPTEL